MSIVQFKQMLGEARSKYARVYLSRGAIQLNGEAPKTEAVTMMTDCPESNYSRKKKASTVRIYYRIIW